MKSKALDTIQNTHGQLGEIIEQDKGRLLDSIRTLEKRILADTKRLVSGKDGKLVGPRINLKQAHQIHADLVKNFKETYEDTAFRVTKGYNQSVKMVKNVYKDLDVSMKFTGIDRDMISELQKRSYNEYLAYGKAAQESISQAMYNAVLTKGSYEDLVGSVSSALTGHLSKSGRPMSAYADVWANDGIMNFHQSVLMKKGNDAGLTSYLYVGNVMDTTRPFCAERVMQTFTQEEIESWDFDWKGKSGPALTNRGGWNCRHHWQPVKKEDVKTLEEEIEKDKEIQEDIKPKIEEPKIEEPEIEEPVGDYQTFDKYLDNVDFDWDALDIDPDDVPGIQNKIIQSRFEDAGNELSEERADDIRVSIQEYTSELYGEYGEWARDPEAYEDGREDWQVEIMKNMDRNLRDYVDDTLPFSSEEELYRGKKELGSLEGVGIGDEIDLKYMSSFSAGEEEATEFAEGGDSPVIMVLNKDNDFNSASLAEFSESGYEREILLGDNNRLKCTSISEKDGVNYMYFDSVEVTEEQREVEEELEEEKVARKEVERKAEEERVAKEEVEVELEEEKRMAEIARKIQEDERIAKEEAEKKLEEERLAKEEAEQRAEEERLAKEEAEKKLVPEEVEEEPLGYVKGKAQVFNKAFEKSGFDWESVEEDYDKIEKKQIKILKQRLESSGIKVDKAELESMFADGIHKYTGSGKFEGFQEWMRDRSEYPDVKTLNEFRTMERHLNKYINETPSFTDKEPLYRGTSLSHDIYKDLEVGDTIQPTGFTSWSTSYDEAKAFAVEDTAEGDKIEDPVILQINKGNQSYSSSIAEFSAYGSEQEILLSDRNKLILTNVEEKDGIKYMYFDTVDITVQEVEAMEEEKRLEEEKLKPEENKREEEEAAIQREETKEEDVAKGWVEPTHEEGYSVVKGDFQNFDSTFIENRGAYEEEGKKLDDVKKALIKERYQDNDVELSDKEVKKIFEVFDDYSYNKTNFEKWLKDPSEDFSKKEIKEFEGMKNSFNSYLDDTRNFNPNMNLYHGFTNYNDNPTFNTLKVGDKLDTGEFSVWTSSSESSKSDSDPSMSWDENPDSTIAVIRKGTEIVSSPISELSTVGGDAAVMVSGKNDLVLEEIEERDGTRYMYFTAKEVVEETEEEIEEREREEEELKKKEEEERVAKEEAEARGKVVINKVAGELPLC